MIAPFFHTKKMTSPIPTRNLLRNQLFDAFLLVHRAYPFFAFTGSSPLRFNHGSATIFSSSVFSFSSSFRRLVSFTFIWPSFFYAIDKKFYRCGGALHTRQASIYLLRIHQDSQLFFQYAHSVFSWSAYSTLKCYFYVEKAFGACT